MNQFVLAAESSGGGAGGFTSLIFLGLMVVVFWLFIIRPQRQRTKKQQELIKSLEVGQEVRTIGGIHGKILSIDDNDVVLKVEEGRLRVTRRAIGSAASEETES